MNKRLTAVIVVLLALALAVEIARHYVPLPPISLDNIATYRFELALSDNEQARLIRQELVTAPNDLAAAERRAVGVGIPFHLVETPPPDNLNALPYYLKWTELRRSKNLPVPLYAMPLALSVSYTPAQLATVRQIYQQNSDSDAVMVEAMDKPFFYQPHGNTNDGMFVGFSDMREAARETYTKATLLALCGNWVQAAQTQATGYKIAGQLKQVHTLIGWLVETAVENIATAGESSLLSHCPAGSKVATTIKTEIGSSAPGDSLKEALEGEAAMEFATAQDERTYVKNHHTTPGGATELSPEDQDFYCRLSECMAARSLNETVSAAEACDEPYAQRRADFNAIDRKRMLTYGKIKDDPGPEVFGRYMSWAELLEHDDSDAARKQVALAAADTMIAKARTGRYPAALPGLHVDPFSGQPLKYRLQNNGIVIYTVGPSGRFDGVIAHKTGWDVYFLYPAPPPKPVGRDALSMFYPGGGHLKNG
jgi:hypothetical protein